MTPWIKSLESIILQANRQFFIPNRRSIISLFQAIEWLLAIAIIIGSTLIYTGSEHTGILYELGVNAGTVALILFFATITAGILRRFGILQPLQQLLMLFRRHLGILTYLFGLTHWLFVRLIFTIKQGVVVQVPPFEFVAFVAMQIMFLQFLTSNDFALRRMGRWWKRLHSLIYAVAWLLFAHVALQGGDLAVAAFVFAAAEVVSFVVLWRRKMKEAAAAADQSAQIM